MTALCRTLSQDIQMAAINAVVEIGSIDPEMIERMAQRSGADSAELARQIETVHEGYYDAVGALGVHDADLFGDFIETASRIGREMHKAVRDMVIRNNSSAPTGWPSGTPIARQDRPGVCHECTQGGWRPQQRHQDSGQIPLTLTGCNEFSYRAAVRLPHQGVASLSTAGPSRCTSSRGGPPAL